MTRTSVIIPKVGQRDVFVNQAGRIFDDNKNDITDKVYPKKEEPFFEDGERETIPTLAESGIPQINGVLLKGTETLKSFAQMKKALENDMDIDEETLDEIGEIEEKLRKLVSSYSEKRMQLREQFGFK